MDWQHIDLFIEGGWISFEYLIDLPCTVEFSKNDPSEHLGSLL